MPDNPPGLSITMKDLFLELKGMHSDLTRVLTHMERVDARNEAADRLHGDHESRLRAVETQIPTGLEGRMMALEKFRWQIAGALIVINVLAVVVEWALSRK